MKIFIVGSGKLANAILNSKLSFQSSKILKWEEKYLSFKEKSILVHAGSGRQIDECLEFCSLTKSIFIELSTGLGTEKITPDFPLIVCPNTSILVLKVIQFLKTFGKELEDYQISVTESHQSSKKTEAGTAIAIANTLQMPQSQIISIRDTEIQKKQIRISKKFLNQHAYHKIEIKNGEEEVISIQTKVLGHVPYVNGLKTIIESILKKEPGNKKYSVEDIIMDSVF